MAGYVVALADTPQGQKGRPSKSFTLDQAEYKEYLAAVGPILKAHGEVCHEGREATAVCMRATMRVAGRAT